jgi:Tfp pilus assembly protein PilP
MPPFLPSGGDIQSTNSNIDPSNTQKETLELFKNKVEKMNQIGILKKGQSLIAATSRKTIKFSEE